MEKNGESFRREFVFGCKPVHIENPEITAAEFLAGGADPAANSRVLSRNYEATEGVYYLRVDFRYGTKTVNDCINEFAATLDPAILKKRSKTGMAASASTYYAKLKWLATRRLARPGWTTRKPMSSAAGA